MQKKILLTGINGQIGYELLRTLQGLGVIIALDRAQMDLADLNQVRNMLRLIRPNLIINAAAYTAVDEAERQPSLAIRINTEAPAVMAEEAKKLGACMIHYSSDYVFDGRKLGAYEENDQPSPINVYGRSKLAGELAIQEADIAYLIFRTSWVYGTRGKNFLQTVLHRARHHQSFEVVSDQWGSPTWCRTVAETTAHVVAQSSVKSDVDRWWKEKSGIYHLTGQGQTSRYGFATEILKQCRFSSVPNIIPIRAKEFPLLAERPINSTLSCALFIKTFCGLPQWEDALRLCLEG